MAGANLNVVLSFRFGPRLSSSNCETVLPVHVQLVRAWAEETRCKMGDTSRRQQLEDERWGPNWKKRTTFTLNHRLSSVPPSDDVMTTELLTFRNFETHACKLFLQSDTIIIENGTATVTKNYMHHIRHQLSYEIRNEGSVRLRELVNTELDSTFFIGNPRRNKH